MPSSAAFASALVADAETSETSSSSSAGQKLKLKEEHWVRNLGHELAGRKVLRTQEKRRLQAALARNAEEQRAEFQAMLAAQRAAAPEHEPQPLRPGLPDPPPSPVSAAGAGTAHHGFIDHLGRRQRGYTDV